MSDSERDGDQRMFDCHGSQDFFKVNAVFFVSWSCAKDVANDSRQVVTVSVYSVPIS